MTDPTASTRSGGAAADAQLLNSSKYSDLTITCGADTHLLHRAIVCPRSVSFDAACEEGSRGASAVTIDLERDDPQTVNRMLIYIYTNDYPDGAIPPHQRPSQPSIEHEPSTLPPHLRTRMVSAKTPDTCPEEDKLMDNVRMYAMGERYHALGLKETAKAKILALTKPDSTYTGTSDFGDIVRFAFESTPDTDNGLRDIFIQLCADFFPDVLVHEGLDAVIKDIAPLSFGILQKHSERKGQLLERAIADGVTLREQLSSSKAETGSAINRERRAQAEKTAALFAEGQVRDQVRESFKSEQNARIQKSELIKERDTAINLRNGAVKDRDAATKEKVEAIDRRALAVRLKDEAISERKELKSKFDQLVKNINDWKYCRHTACDSDFDARLEYMPSRGDCAVQLRCRECRTRHDVGWGMG